MVSSLVGPTSFTLRLGSFSSTTVATIAIDLSKTIAVRTYWSTLAFACCVSQLQTSMGDQRSSRRRCVARFWRAGSRGQRNTSSESRQRFLQKEVSLKRGRYRPRQRPLTEAQIEEIWTRRAAGEAATRIARHMGRYARSIGDYLYEAGGIRPRPRSRSRIALTVREREEISRGLAAADSLRSIAVRIGRAPSTVSREVARNYGRQNYRAG